MVGNLVKPPHLKRFLLALGAGAGAMVIYLNAEHFKVVPATGALDHETPSALALGDHSLAVLPLASNEPGTLSSVLALELIRRLVRIPDIEVVAARSAVALADIEGIPRGQSPSLETAWLLEVQAKPEGDEFRLGALLTTADGEAPAWALEQLRPASEMPLFIEAVTLALAEYLDIEISGKKGALPAGEASVYRDYQMAWQILALGAGGGVDPRPLLDRVLEAAPGWAPALTARAYSYILRAATGEGDVESLLDLARADLQAAENLQPELAEIYVYRSLIAHRFEWSWERAYELAGQALARAPGDAAVLEAASTAAFTLGRFEEGLEQLRRAVALDPLVLNHRLKLGLMLEFSGAHQSAIDAYRELMVIEPDYPGAHAYLGRTLVIVGRAEPGLRHMAFEPSAFWQAYGRVLALRALGREQESEAELEDLTREYGGQAAVQIAELHAWAGRIDLAFQWLNTAVEQRDPGVASLIGNPLLDGLQEDPRWLTLLERLGLPTDKDAD